MFPRLIRASAHASRAGKVSKKEEAKMMKFARDERVVSWAGGVVLLPPGVCGAAVTVTAAGLLTARAGSERRSGGSEEG